MNQAGIRRIGNMRFQCGRINADPPGPNGLTLHQVADQFHIEGGDTLSYEFDRPEKLWYAGGRIGWLSGEFLHRRSLSDGTLSWLTGMGMLIPIKAFRHAGEYDEGLFPRYIGNADFSIHARKAGYTLAIEPSSKMWNKTGVCSHDMLRKNVTWRNFFKPFVSRKSAYELDMRIWLYRRHWPTPLIPVAFTAYLGRVIRKQLIRVLGVQKA